MTNNQHQLDYVNIAGYISIFEHRNDKRGGRVGFYIKDNIFFKTRNDLTKNIVNMEVTFIKRVVVVTTTVQLHSTKPELRFCAGSNPAYGVSEIRDGEDLWQWSRLEIRLSAFCRSTIPQKQFIFFIRLYGRNKNIPYLVAVAHQPSPYESDKLLFLENFEAKKLLKWQPAGMVLSL